jgi:methylated-DNA-[protein]-cysteine S-methyltransferase
VNHAAGHRATHETYYTYVETPIGTVLLAGCEDHGLRYLGFQCGKGAIEPEPHWRHSDALFHDAMAQLREYFAGTRRQFDLRLHPKGTDFQKSVWRALQRIPYGETRSYADLAGAIGRPTAVRAVGLANGANPLPIVIPCHRVIGKDGSLTGYGGGLAIKEALLRLEGAWG